MHTTEEVIAATKDIKHPLRVAYVEYIRECRAYGCNPLSFFQWIRESPENQ